MARPTKYCRWWESADGFEDVRYFTDCSSGSPLKGDEHELAQLIWKLGQEYCPFCGSYIDYCEPSEVLAQDEDDREYREGVRYGLYGY
jgi:hypothetical protein